MQLNRNKPDQKFDLFLRVVHPRIIHLGRVVVSVIIIVLLSQQSVRLLNCPLFSYYYYYYHYYLVGNISKSSYRYEY